MAHALYVDKFLNAGDADWEMWTAISHMELQALNQSEENHFFRDYGKTNVHEFWAVCVECFFEDPINFKSQHERLYFATANVLKQDMALRKISVK